MNRMINQKCDGKLEGSPPNRYFEFGFSGSELTGRTVKHMFKSTRKRISSGGLNIFVV